jgi:hypothetical protein
MAALALGKLDKALQSKILSNEAETHHWRGRVLQIQGVTENVTAEMARTLLDEKQFKDASDALKTAADLSLKNGLSDGHVASYTLAWAEHALMHPDFREAPDRRKAVDEVHRRSEVLRMLKLKPTVEFDPDQEAHILYARGSSLMVPAVPASKRAMALLVALDSAAKELPKNPKDATKSAIKVLGLRLQQRETILRTPELIGENMGQPALDEAVWYAGVPDGIAREPKVRYFDVASLYFDKLSTRFQLHESKHRRSQASALRLAIAADDRDPRVFERYEALATLWVASIKAGADQDELLDAGRHVQTIRDRLQAALENDPQLQTVGRDYLNTLKGDKKKWDEHMLRIGNLESKVAPAPPLKTK